MREDALAIFFSSNLFVIIGYDNYIGSPSEVQTRVSASMSLTEVVPRHALRYLRFLEIVFPPLVAGAETAYCQPGMFDYNDWVYAIEMMRWGCSINLLTLRVHMAEFIYDGDPREEFPFFGTSMTRERERALLITYQRIVLALSRLNEMPESTEPDYEQRESGARGRDNHEHCMKHKPETKQQLDRFFASIWWPWRYMQHETFASASDVQRHTRALEEQLEKLVMQDGYYDSTQLPRHHLEEIPWLTDDFTLTTL